MVANEKPLALALPAVGVLLPLPPKRPPPPVAAPKRLLEGAPDVGWFDIMKLFMCKDFPTPPGMKENETTEEAARRDSRPD